MATRECMTSGVPWSRSARTDCSSSRRETGSRSETGGPSRSCTPPGHAKHHIVFFEDETGGAFVGDAVGIAFPHGHIVQPVTPPPDFDPHLAADNLRRIAARSPAFVGFAHFGPASDAAGTLAAAEDRLWDWVAWVERAGDGDLTAAMRTWVLDDYRHRDTTRRRLRRSIGTPSGPCRPSASSAGSRCEAEGYSAEMAVEFVEARKPRVGGLDRLVQAARRTGVAQASRGACCHEPHPQLALLGLVADPLRVGDLPGELLVAGVEEERPVDGAPSRSVSRSPPILRKAVHTSSTSAGRSRARRTSISTGMWVVSPVRRRKVRSHAVPGPRGQGDMPRVPAVRERLRCEGEFLGGFEVAQCLAVLGGGKRLGRGMEEFKRGWMRGFGVTRDTSSWIHLGRSPSGDQRLRRRPFGQRVAHGPIGSVAARATAVRRSPRSGADRRSRDRSPSPLPRVVIERLPDESYSRRWAALSGGPTLQKSGGDLLSRGLRPKYHQRGRA